MKYMRAQAGEMTPLGLIIAGVVFLAAGLSNSSVPNIIIVDAIGAVLLIAGIIGFAAELHH